MFRSLILPNPSLNKNLIDETVRGFKTINLHNNLGKDLLVKSTKDLFLKGRIETKTSSILEGFVYLESNTTHWLMDYVTDSSDLVLPKNPKPEDWIMIQYENTQAANLIHWFNRNKICIHRNGNKILGFEENLIIDMPFMVLKFVYKDYTHGWLLV